MNGMTGMSQLLLLLLEAWNEDMVGYRPVPFAARNAPDNGETGLQSFKCTGATGWPH